ncbi:MAG: ABC transporter substrate-binding protein [Sedimentisphaerales bacterium]|nr:ABC transporter substrate-binding protein [Sedimentisphaerales bacterium]
MLSEIRKNERKLFTFAVQVIICTLVICSGIASAETRFADEIGNVTVGDFKETTPMKVPFILWGGDIPTFYANGGLKTQPGTIFANLGLNIELVRGDDFLQQVRDYMKGDSAFLRGVFGMPSQASEVIGSDSRTKPYMFMQMTWSAGDHCVAREEIKTLTDLKGKKICLQTGGPHDVGFVDDVLTTAGLKRDDVTLVFAKDLTATANSPAEMFRKDSSIAACFVVSPDMIGLTGGFDSIGTGAEGTVKGAHILVSTAELSYSIADTYVCRSDYWTKHSDVVTKFAAGYLKACEEVIDLKKAYESNSSSSNGQKYRALLQMAQDIYGKTDIPTIEDAHGLLCDCTFVGHPGNIAFFKQANNSHGFDVFQNKLLDIVVSRGYAKVRQGIFPSPIDWNSSAFDILTKKQVARGERFNPEAVLKEIEALNQGSLDTRTILSFAINFKSNQDTFSELQYGSEYQRVVDALGKFGNAVIAIRGHADVTKVLSECVQAGMEKNILKQSGTTGNYNYYLNGRPLDLNSTAEIVKLIDNGSFDGSANHNPREVMNAARNLSRSRAEAVRDSIVDFARKNNITLDISQIQPVGVGVKEPLITKPSNMAEAEQNMRVEFRIIRVNAEAINPSDFDF